MLFLLLSFDCCSQTVKLSKVQTALIFMKRIVRVCVGLKVKG